MGRKHCWKRRIGSLQAISPFPTMFSRLVLQSHNFKAGLVWERVKFWTDRWTDLKTDRPTPVKQVFRCGA